MVMDETKADKGLKGGSCNRRACQRPGAWWLNRGTDAYYCTPCARLINDANPDTWRIGIYGPLCVSEHPPIISQLSHTETKADLPPARVDRRLSGRLLARASRLFGDDPTFSGRETR